jgi:photosystem II stability/assembly factor-like uncharacterized protein
MRTPARRAIFGWWGALAAGLLLLSGSARAQRLTAVNAAGLAEDFTCMGMSHRDPSFVMVGTASGKLLRTLDGGSTWEPIVVTPARALFYGRERQPDPSWEYAPGLPGKSPYLQSWLRRSGLATSGINMAQLLFQKGEKPVTINWIEVDWNNERRVFVATSSGLYASSDKARTFVRVFQGTATAAERNVNAVATDPSDPKRILVGTASGLYSSRNGGVTFEKTMDYYMRDSFVREIWFDPAQKGLVHVAMAGSAMASPDAGLHWITTHWNDSAPRADVQSISLGPNNIRVIGTRDGVFASWQGGEMGTWQRRGLRFVGSAVSKVLTTTDPKVWYALTDDALWRTENAGASWRPVFQLGGKEAPRWLMAFGGQVQNMWLLTSRGIYRVGTPPLSRRYSLTMRASPDLLRVPPLADFLRRLLKHHRIYFPDNQRTRERHLWAAFLPGLTGGGQYTRAIETPNYQSIQFRQYSFTSYQRPIDRVPSWYVFASWDLSELIFSKMALPHWGRVERNLAAIRQDLSERVHRLYLEYRRLARILVYAPPADELVRQYHEIRLQEISAYLDAVSDGDWSKGTTSRSGGDS